MKSITNTIFADALRLKDQDILKAISMIIALAVRNNIEDFHVKHLTDAQMKELNPLIRNGIYNALYALSQSDNNEYAQAYVDLTIRSVPNYWEEPELESRLAAIARKQSMARQKPLHFKSAFLTEELAKENIQYDPQSGFLSIKGSYDFKLEEGKNAHNHRNKISTALRKEKWLYISSLGVYRLAERS